MRKSRFTEAQIPERGYRVAELTQRHGARPHSQYAWTRQLVNVAPDDTGKDAEIRRLKRELARVAEERGILKRATAYLTFGHRLLSRAQVPGLGLALLAATACWYCGFR